MGAAGARSTMIDEKVGDGPEAKKGDILEVHYTGWLKDGKKFVVAGLWTEACVMFPTLDLLREGFEIYIAADACGDISPEAHQRAMDRAVQAGAVPITALQYVFELQQDWARSETYEGVMDILRAHSPYGIQVRFSKWALGEHASEAGPAPKRG